MGRNQKSHREKVKTYAFVMGDETITYIKYLANKFNVSRSEMFRRMVKFYKDKNND